MGETHSSEEIHKPCHFILLKFILKNAIIMKQNLSYDFNG
jgi:hypothetical protein